MKAFHFVAFDSIGGKKIGTVRAWSLSHAKKVIKQKGFYLTYIDIRDNSPHARNSASFLKKLKKLIFAEEKI